MSSDEELEPVQLPAAGSNDPTRIRENPLHAAETVAQQAPVPTVAAVEVAPTPGRGGVPLLIVVVIAFGVVMLVGAVMVTGLVLIGR